VICPKIAGEAIFCRQARANDGFEKLPPAERPVEDLGETDFRLENRELIRKAAGRMGGRQREGDLLLPARKEPGDRRGIQRVAHLLERLGSGARQKAVVQRGESDPTRVELSLRPFVSVEADLDRIWGIAADLDEGRSPLGVEEIDVVVVHVDGFPEVDKFHEAAALLFGRGPRGGAFLGDANQDDATARVTARPVALNDRVFTFALPEFDPRNAVLVGPGPERRFERRRDLAEDRRRGNFLPAGSNEKVNHAAPALQPRDVRVEIQAVDAPHFQGHVVFDNLGNVRHDTSSWLAPEEISPRRRPRREASRSDALVFPHRVADRREAALNQAT